MTVDLSDLFVKHFGITWYFLFKKSLSSVVTVLVIKRILDGTTCHTNLPGCLVTGFVEI